MKRLSILFSLLFSASAFAHVHVGEYKGAAPDGSACSFTVLAVTHEESHHPLNERVIVLAGTERFVLSHPASVNSSGAVHFDHDLLSGAKGRGAFYMVAHLKMEHSPTKDGPTELVVFRSSAKSAPEKFVCSNLVEPASAE